MKRKNYQFKVYTGLFTNTALTLVRRLFSVNRYDHWLDAVAEPDGEVVIASTSTEYGDWRDGKYVRTAKTREWVSDQLANMLQNQRMYARILELTDGHRVETVAKYLAFGEDSLPDADKKVIEKLRGKRRDDVKTEVRACLDEAVGDTCAQYENFRSAVGRHDIFPSVNSLFGVYGYRPIRRQRNDFAKIPEFVPVSEIAEFERIETEMIAVNNQFRDVISRYDEAQCRFKTALDEMKKHSTAIRNEKIKALKREFKV